MSNTLCLNNGTCGFKADERTQETDSYGTLTNKVELKWIVLDSSLVAAMFVINDVCLVLFWLTTISIKKDFTRQFLQAFVIPLSIGIALGHVRYLFVAFNVDGQM